MNKLKKRQVGKFVPAGTVSTHSLASWLARTSKNVEIWAVDGAGTFEFCERVQPRLCCPHNAARRQE